MNTTKRISNYLKGKLDEQQAMDLWADLIKEPEKLKMLEMELRLVLFFRQFSMKSEKS